MSSFQPTNETWRPARTASGPRAEFTQRLVADFVDGVAILLLGALVQAVLPLPDALSLVAVSFGYLTLLEGGVSGQTLGKRLMRIQVRSLEDGLPLGYQQALVRTLARYLSWIPLWLGYFWMLWSRERQTWHDMLSGAVVVPEVLQPRAPW